jgi:peptidoglycan hydrolase-like protein with peptidoglycan-binding domain
MSAAAEAPRLRRRGRAVRAVAGTVAVLAVAGGVVWVLLPGGSSPAPAVNDQVPLGSAAVERRDLIDRQDVDGTLGYAGTQTAAAPSAGTITRLRPEGATVTRGRSLLSIDAKATGWVLYGTRPMYRDLGPGVTDGSDVRQLESNLAALGYDPGTVDADWTWQTTAAVKAFQKDRGLTENGTLRRTDVIVSDGPARVGAHKAAVTVTLPDGRTVSGTITKVGTVATPGQNGAAPTVPLDVALRSRRHGRLDGAPVTLSLAIGKTKNALAVPVTALVATGPSAYAVELAGSRRLVRVTLGASANGWTQVTGAGLTAGTRVVVPR